MSETVDHLERITRTLARMDARLARMERDLDEALRPHREDCDVCRRLAV